MNSNFEYYKIFFYVAKYNNLTNAAAILQTSQPAVTRTIHKLEADLGCRLFIRSKSGMTLTAEGKVFYDYISAGYKQFFNGERAISDLLTLEDGTISISATETALHCYLFRAIEAFNAKYPKIHFKILNNSSTDSVHSVLAGEVDIAVVSSIPHTLKAPLQVQKLHAYQDILIAGSRYASLNGRQVQLKELIDYPWIALTSESVTRDFVNKHFEKHGLTFMPDIELATTDMILPAVRHNLGIGFIPFEFACGDMEAGTVFRVSLKESIPLREISLIYDTEFPQSIASRKFRQFMLKEYLQE